VQELDHKILSGIRHDDEKSFDLLFEIYYKKLCNYNDSIIHDYDMSEDIVQDLFAHIWVNRYSVTISSSLSSYLFKSCYNSCLDYIKHLKSVEKFLSDNSWQSTVSYNDTMEYMDLLENLEKSIENLPDQCKAIFKLSRFENLKYVEIAKKLNISENTVDTQIRRALKKLKESLSNYIPAIIVILSQLW
jgi:RNA polymerase sigma-70 factor (family 1)